jgi:hypothetical protein
LLSCRRASEELGESFRGDAGSPGRLRRSPRRAQEPGDRCSRCVSRARGTEGQSSGSSVASRLRSLGRLVIERLRGALRLGVQKTLGLTSSHYKLNFTLLLDGYVVPEDVVGEEPELEAVRKIDAFMADNVASLADMFEVNLFPDAAEGEAAASSSPRAP